MQAVEIKRNPVTRIGITAVAVVILAAFTLGLIVLNVSGGQALTVPAPGVNRFEEIKLLEDNIPLPVYAGNPARSLAEMQLMEENVEFQTRMSSPALSHLDIKLIEDNVALPVSTGSSARIHANMEVEE